MATFEEVLPFHYAVSEEALRHPRHCEDLRRSNSWRSKQDWIALPQVLLAMTTGRCFT
jgi:hypothetical protein